MTQQHTLKQIRYQPDTTFYRVIVFSIVITALAGRVSAQLQRFPLPKHKAAIHKASTNARTKSASPLLLPFFDDFSSTKKDYPDTIRWEQNQSVNVNNGVAINEPTLNVATLDGLNAENLPYNAADILANGITDLLTSKPIDLSAIPPAQKDSLFLSFFYQAGGNGEPPDKNDHLILEFKTADSVWNNILTIYPLENFDPTIFYDTLVPITDDIYLHETFQFRIGRYGRESGPFDAWNIDYVYLNTGRSSTDISYPDRALASGLSPLFGRYYAVPLKHFYKNNLFSDLTIDVKNLKATATPIDITLDVSAFFRNYNKGSQAPVITSKVLSGTVNSNLGIMQPYERAKSKITSLPDPGDVSLFTADSLITAIVKVQVVSGDDTDPGRSRMAPIDLKVNDTLSSSFTVKDYYAYDDGTAEYSAGLTQSGNLGAYLFEMQDTATLSSFDIYFPEFAIGNNQAMDFNIYDDNNGLPGKSLYAIASRSITPQVGLNTFTHILMEPVAVPQKFYIGWSQPLSGSPKIGLDTSNDTGDKFFAKVNGSWTPNTKVHGSLMIRPVLGKGVINTVTGLPTTTEKSNLALYPNPNGGTFFIKGHYDHLQIINITGQSLFFLTEDFNDEKKIVIPSAAAGLYLAQIQTGGAIETKKIVVK